MAAKRIPARFKTPGAKTVKPHFITKNVQPVVYNPANPNQKPSGKYYWNPLLSEAERTQGIKAIEREPTIGNNNGTPHAPKPPALEYTPPHYQRTFPTVDRTPRVPARMIPPLVVPKHQPSTSEDVVMKDVNLVSFPSSSRAKPVPRPMRIKPVQPRKAPDPSPFGIAESNHIVQEIEMRQAPPLRRRLTTPAVAKQDVVMMDRTYSRNVEMVDVDNLSTQFSKAVTLKSRKAPTSSAVTLHTKKRQRPAPYTKPKMAEPSSEPSSSRNPRPVRQNKTRHNLIKRAVNIKNLAERGGTVAEGNQASKRYQKYVARHSISDKEIGDYVTAKRLRKRRN